MGGGRAWPLACNKAWKGLLKMKRHMTRSIVATLMAASLAMGIGTAAGLMLALGSPTAQADGPVGNGPCSAYYDGGFKRTCELKPTRCAGGFFLDTEDCEASFRSMGTRGIMFPTVAYGTESTGQRNGGITCKSLCPPIEIYRCRCNTLGDWCDLSGCKANLLYMIQPHPGYTNGLEDCAAGIGP